MDDPHYYSDGECDYDRGPDQDRGDEVDDDGGRPDRPRRARSKTAEEWRQLDGDALAAAIRRYHPGPTRVLNRIIDGLSPESAHQLGYLNPWSRPVWEAALREAAIEHGVPRKTAWTLTIIHSPWDTNINATAHQLRNIRRRIRRMLKEYLAGLNYIGMIEFAVFKTDLLDGTRRVSPHLQLIVWGGLTRDRVRALRAAFAGGMDGTTGAEARVIDDFAGATAYTVKPPSCGYYRDKHRNGKRWTRIWQFESLAVRYRLWEILGHLAHPDLTLAGGEGEAVKQYMVQAAKCLPAGSHYANGGGADDADAADTMVGDGGMFGGTPDDTPIPLAARIVGLIDSGVDPRRILVATHTEAGARRLAAQISAQTCRALPWLGSYHGVAARLLRQECDLAALRPDFTVIGADHAKALIAEAAVARHGPAARRHLDQIVAGVAWFKKRLMTPEMAASFASEREAGLPRSRPGLLRVAVIYGDYQRLLHARNQADRLDLLLWLLIGLERDEPLRRKWAGMFDAVAADGYFDASANQYNLIAHLAGDRQPIFSVAAEW